MDTSVGYELVQGQAGDFAAHGIEPAQDDRFGRVVHDDFDACGSFQRPDVATFAADDAAFDFVAFDVEHRNGVFDGRFGRHTLDRSHDDSLGLLRGGHFGLLDRFVDVGCSVGFGFRFHIFDQDALGIFGAQARNLLEARVLLVHQTVDLLLLVFEHLKLRFHLLFEAGVLLDLAFQFALLVLQVVFDLLGPLFALGDLLDAFIDLAVVLALELDELLLGLENLLFLYHFAFRFRLFPGGFTQCLDGLLGNVFGYQDVNTQADYGGQDAR